MSEFRMGLERAIDAVKRLHDLASAPSAFNTDILAIESRREAYELAIEAIANIDAAAALKEKSE